MFYWDTTSVKERFSSMLLNSPQILTFSYIVLNSPDSPKISLVLLNSPEFSLIPEESPGCKRFSP
jgi:hypothetical protein